MPLHDWSELGGWDGVRKIWLVELLRWVKPRLPEGYRVYIRAVPTAAEADSEVAALEEPNTAIHVERQHRLVAALELISPRNKDRPATRATYLAKYVGYLLEGGHLLLVDVHRRPLAFSFADEIARELQMERPACAAPFAISYRVGEPVATGGRFLAIWQRCALAAGMELPVLPLPITVDVEVAVDLEATYRQAAADAYLP